MPPLGRAWDGRYEPQPQPESRHWVWGQGEGEQAGLRGRRGGSGPLARARPRVGATLCAASTRKGKEGTSVARQLPPLLPETTSRGGGFKAHIPALLAASQVRSPNSPPADTGRHTHRSGQEAGRWAAPSPEPHTDMFTKSCAEHFPGGHGWAFPLLPQEPPHPKAVSSGLEEAPRERARAGADPGPEWRWLRQGCTRGLPS